MIRSKADWRDWVCECCDFKTKNPDSIWCITCQWAACPECMFVADPSPDCERHRFIWEHNNNDKL